jgi:hypothetical protein
LKLGQACLTFTSENPSCCIASFIIDIISTNLIESAVFAKLHPACFAISIGSKGIEVLPVGVVFVGAHSGVVGLAWPVVSA